MRRVYICQKKCTNNHCIVANYGAFDSDEQAHRLLSFALGIAFGTMVKLGLVNNRCEICGSTEYHVETGRTKFETIAEAFRPMMELQEQQRQAQAFFRGARN